VRARECKVWCFTARGCLQGDVRFHMVECIATTNVHWEQSCHCFCTSCVWRLHQARDILKSQLLIQFANHVSCVSQVKAYISPKRLLVYNVSEGWKPLCDFLHVEVPSTPFPKSNTMREAETWTPIEKVDYVYVGLPIAAVIAAVIALKRAHKN
jgi:hypothetical protein